MLTGSLSFLCVSCEDERAEIIPNLCERCFNDLNEDLQCNALTSIKPHSVAFWVFSY